MPPLTSIRPHLPATVEALAARCLSPDPAARPASAAALQAELRDILFDIQVGPEPHRRLREYLVGRSLANGASRLQSSSLANALIDQARKVPSLRRDSPEASTDSLVSSDSNVEPTARAPQRAEGQPAEVDASSTGSLAEVDASPTGSLAEATAGGKACSRMTCLVRPGALEPPRRWRWCCCYRAPPPSGWSRRIASGLQSGHPSARWRDRAHESGPCAPCRPCRPRPRGSDRGRAVGEALALGRALAQAPASTTPSEAPGAAQTDFAEPRYLDGGEAPSPVPKKQLRYQEL